MEAAATLVLDIQTKEALEKLGAVETALAAIGAKPVSVNATEAAAQLKTLNAEAAAAVGSVARVGAAADAGAEGFLKLGVASNGISTSFKVAAEEVGDLEGRLGRLAGELKAISAGGFDLSTMIKGQKLAQQETDGSIRSLTAYIKKLEEVDGVVKTLGQGGVTANDTILKQFGVDAAALPAKLEAAREALARLQQQDAKQANDKLNEVGTRASERAKYLAAEKLAAQEAAQAQRELAAAAKSVADDSALARMKAVEDRRWGQKYATEQAAKEERELTAARKAGESLNATGDRAAQAKRILDIERQMVAVVAEENRLRNLNETGDRTARASRILALEKEMVAVVAEENRLRTLNESGVQDAERKKVLAAEKQITQELKLQRDYILATDKQRVASALSARKLMDAGQTNNLKTEFAPQTLTTASSSSAAALEGQMAALSRTTSAGGKAMQESAKHMGHWNTVANESHAFARGLSGSLGTLWMTYGSIAPLLAGAALASSFIQAAKAGSEFAYQLTFVKALGGETAQSIAQISKAALELSRNSMYDPTELAGGLRMLSQAGLGAKDAIAALPTVMQLATVGEMNMEQSALTLVGVMNAFNMSLADLPHIGDMFSKAAALSQTSVSAMTEAMKTASVVHDQYGASVEDTATAITLLAKVNITGTAAGTAYRNMLKDIYTPSAEAAKVMEQLGVKTKDAMGNLRDAPEILFDLKKTLADYTQGSQTDILGKIFSERGGKDAIAILGETRESWEALKGLIQNSEGFMKGVSGELNDAVKGQWLQAVNEFKVQLVEAYDSMAPVFLKITQSLKSMFADEAFISGLRTIVGAMASLSQILVENAGWVIKAAEAFVVYKAAALAASLATTGLLTIAKVSAEFKILTTTVGAANVMLPLFASTLGAVATGAATTTAGLTGVAGAATLLANPIGIIAGLLIAGVGLWYAYGQEGSRQLDRLRTDAENTKSSVDRLNNVMSEVRLGDITADAGIGAVKAGFKEFNAEVAAFEKTVRSQFTTKNLTFDSEFRLRDSAGTPVYLRDEFEQRRKGLVERGGQLKEFANELGEKKLTSPENLVTDPAPKSGTKTFTPATTKTGGSNPALKTQALEGRANAAQLEYQQSLQKGELDLLNSGYQAKLVSGEDYRIKLQAIYEGYDDKIRQGYATEVERLKSIKAKALGDEKILADIQLQKMLKAEETYRQSKELALKKSLDNESKITQEAWAKTNKLIAEQVEATEEAKRKLEATRIKSTMTPEQAASYDASSASKAKSNKNISAAESELQSLRDKKTDTGAPVYAETSKEIQTQIAVIEELIAAREALAASAGGQAAKEIAYQREFSTGWTKAYKDASDAATDYGKMGEQVANGIMDVFETFLFAPLDQGWKDQLKAFGVMLQQMVAKAVAADLMNKIMGKGTGVAGGSSGGGLGGIADLFGSMLGGNNAPPGTSDIGPTMGLLDNVASIFKSSKGNVFSGPSGLGQFSNTVQTSPQTFAFGNVVPFAKGAAFKGSLAEKDPEAIMPLARDSAGRLGIRTQGSAQNNQVPSVVVNLYGNNNNAPDVRRAAGQGAREALAAFQGAQRYA